MLSHQALRYVISCLILLCFGVSGIAFAESGIGIYLNQSYFAPGQGTPQLSVSAFNTETPIMVDVHVGVIAQDGTIYEYPDWNTKLKPWLSSISLPQNFNYPVTPVVTLPNAIPSGIWTAFAAFTEPGTINIISLDVASFNMLPATANSSSYGALYLTHSQTPTGMDVASGGFFAQTSRNIEELIENFDGQQPGLEQCVFNETAIDISAIQGFQVNTLDAGDALQLSSSTGLLTSLPKDVDAESVGFIVYTAPDGQLGSGFYQGGANYTFQGFGGQDIQPFSVGVSAPPPLTLTQPALNMSASHNTASDLPLLWNGNGGVGEVHASLSGTDLTKTYTIDCRFSDDGNSRIPSSLLARLKNKLGDGAISIPGVELPPGIELPPGFEIPGLGATVTLSVSRSSYSMFNTANGKLSYGIATIDTGASMSLTLE